MIKYLLRSLLATTLLVSLPLRAQTFNESPDAGQTPATAQNSGLTQSSSVGGAVTILGSISGINDADVFRLTITLPTQIQFSTVNTLTANSGGAGGLDTALFLFTNAGAPIFTNDDANGMVLQSTLPSGTTFTTTLAPGTYLLSISLSGNEPTNSSGQLVFASDANPGAVRGPAPGLNPGVFNNFNNGASFAQSGNYQIDITTMAVPEPSTISLLAGAIVMGALFFRKRAGTLRNVS